jgi:hypothetical protein
MLRRTLPILCILSSILLFACAKNPTVAPPTNRDDGPTIKAAGTPPATTASTGKIGVPECDEYLAKVDACVKASKLPEVAKATYTSSMEANRKAWLQAASTPEGKASLAAACKKATDDARTSMKSLNCTF